MPARPSSHAVRRAPWSSGRVSETHTSASRPLSKAVRRIPPAVPWPAVASGPVLQWVSARCPASKKRSAPRRDSSRSLSIRSDARA